MRALSQRFSSAPNGNSTQPQTVIVNNQTQQPVNEIIYSEVPSILMRNTNLDTSNSNFNGYSNVNIRLFNECAENPYANTLDMSLGCHNSGNGQLPTSSENRSIYENLQNSFGLNAINVKTNKNEKKLEQSSYDMYVNMDKTATAAIIKTGKPQEEQIYENMSFRQNTSMKKIRPPVSKKPNLKNKCFEDKPAVFKKPNLKNTGSSETLIDSSLDTQQKSGIANTAFAQPSVKDIIKQLNLKK